MILRSSVAHGHIRGIETGAARARPGVFAVITAADIGAAIPRIPLRQESSPEFEPFEQPVIAHGKVRYVGEPIAIVLAESAGAAEDALDAITLDIETLPAIVDSAAARSNDIRLFEAAGSNLALTLTGVRGDADAAFNGAAYIRRERFTVQRHGAVPMEPRGLLAEWDAAGGRLTVHGAAKVAFLNRRVLAKHFGLPESAIRMVENDVGGGFGARGEFYPEDFLIPFAARLSGRPVKWIEDRREHLLATNHARDAECELEIACDKDGTILALRGRAFTDQGAYIRTNGPTAARNIAQVLTGPYRIPHVRIDVSLMMTNKTPSGTYRGPGRFEADFFRERLFDIAAADLGLDRVAFRRRNLIAEAEMPYRLATVAPLNIGTETDSGDYAATLDALPRRDRLDREGGDPGQADRRPLSRHCDRMLPRRRRIRPEGERAPRARSRRQGLGLCRLLVHRPGPGNRLCADRRRCARNSMQRHQRRCYHGSTDDVIEGYGSYSSRSVVMGGNALVMAAGSCATPFAMPPPSAGTVPQKTYRSMPARRWHPTDDHCRSAPSPATSAESSYASNKRTYSYGAHAAHVAVDPKTGRVELLDYVAVEDVGRIINPLTLHGQCVGAIVQGLGGAFLEHFVYDRDGQLLTGSFADYLLPTASDFPSIRAVALEEKPSPTNPLGAKGAGEGGIIPVGGVVANAVAAALSSLGVEPHDLPLSPPRVWELIRAARPPLVPPSAA